MKYHQISSIIMNQIMNQLRFQVFEVFYEFFHVFPKLIYTNHEVHLRQLHHHHEALWLVTSDPTKKVAKRDSPEKCSEIM